MICGRSWRRGGTFQIIFSFPSTSCKKTKRVQFHHYIFLKLNDGGIDCFNSTYIYLDLLYSHFLDIFSQFFNVRKTVLIIKYKYF